MNKRDYEKRVEIQAYTTDERMRILSEIASRQKLIRRRNNIIRNVILTVISVFILAMFAFGIFLSFAEEKHAVSFFVESKLIKKVEIKDGENINASLIPEVESKIYNFDGYWYTNASGEGEHYDFSQPIKNNLNLYAGITIKIIDLKIFLNDNENELEKSYIINGRYNQLINILDQNYINENLANEYKVYYDLIGFDRNPNAISPEFTSSQIKLIEGELYAIWQGKKILVPVSGEGSMLIGGGNYAGENLSLNYGSTYIVDIDKYSIVCGQDTGAQVEGIRTNKSDKIYKDGESILITDGIQFSLAFIEEEKNMLTINFNNGLASKTYYGIQKITLPIITKQHYGLEGYNGIGGTLSAGTEITVEGILVYEASWINDIYLISLNVNGATNDCTKVFYQQYEKGFYLDSSTETQLDKIVVPYKYGYDFSGYYMRVGSLDILVINANGEFVDVTNTTFKANTTLIAQYNLKSYTVFMDNTNEFGIISANSSTIVNHGGIFQFKVNLKAEYNKSYGNLLSNLQKNYAVYRITPGAANEHTIYEITNITADINLTISNLPLNSYTITWANWNGETVESTTVEHGSMPAYPEDKDKPIRIGTSEISFLFANIWDKAIVQAKSDTTYYARYKGIIKDPVVVSSLVYNGGAQTPTITANNYYIMNVTPQKNAGTYNLTVSLNNLADNTVSHLEWVSGNTEPLILEWKILKKTLTAPTVLGATTFEYNGAEQEVKFTPYDETSISITGNRGINVDNTYLAVISVTDTNNHLWDSGDTENISISWQITKANLTVTVKNATKIFDGLVYIFDGNPATTSDLIFNGFKGNDSKTSGAINGIFTFTGEGVTAVDVGNYAVILSQQDVTSVNYHLILADGRLNITIQGGVAKPTFVSSEFKYIGEEIDIRNSLDENYISNIMAVSGNIVERNVGTYNITISLDNNYEWEDGQDKSFILSWTISPASLTIIVENTSRNYGDENPEFNYTAETLLGGDSIFNIFSDFELTTTATKNSNVGLYDITVNGTQISNNYIVETFAGKLNITYKLITKIIPINTSFTFDGTLKSVEVSVYDDKVINVTGNTATDAGNYIAVYSLKNTNYKWEDETTVNIEIGWIINVSEVEVPVIIGNDFFEFNGSPQSPNITESVYYNILGNVGTDTKLYIAVVSLKDKNNYCWVGGSTEDIELQWSIKPKLLVVPTASGNTSFVYNGAEQELQLATLDYDLMLLNITGNTQINVGNHTVTISLKDNNNYNWATGDITADITIPWVITKATLTVTALNKIIEYGDALPSFNGNVSTTEDADKVLRECNSPLARGCITVTHNLLSHIVRNR